MSDPYATLSTVPTTKGKLMNYTDRQEIGNLILASAPDSEGAYAYAFGYLLAWLSDEQLQQIKSAKEGN